jgi:hypothetical protein
MRSTILLLVFAFSQIIALEPSKAPLVVPLIECEETNCWFEGQWKPNGTLIEGEWAYFEVDLTYFYDGDLPRADASFEVDLDQLNVDGTVGWYIREDEIPTDDYSSSGSTFTCDDPECLLMPQSIQVCNLENSKYYVGVHNLGNGTATFEVQFFLQRDGNVRCPPESSEEEWAWFSMIVLVFYVGIPLLCVTFCCSILCCLFWRHKRHKRSCCKYQKINDGRSRPSTQTQYQSINGDEPHPPSSLPPLAALPHPPSSPPPQYTMPVTYAFYPQNVPAAQNGGPVAPPTPTPSAPPPPNH